MRLFYSKGITTVQLTDSSIYKDLIMVNDGYCIWREDFNFLWLYDGVNPPQQIIDSLQMENPYVAGGSIGFFGFKLADSTIIKSAWLYNINSKTLIKITTDRSNNWNVLCDGNSACWLNTDTEKLMFFDGNTTIILSDSVTLSDYSYRNGKIVWSERRNGIYQILMYDITAKSKFQLTNDGLHKLKPATDGSKIVWYEVPDFLSPSNNPVMIYYDINTKQKIKVTHFYPSFNRWQWLSNGKITWAQNGNVFVFDGEIISQLTNDDFWINSEADIEHEILEWRKSPAPNNNNNGDIFIGKLQPRVSFNAENIIGSVPLTVSFNNNSWQGTQTYHWDFGDGETSQEREPEHTFNTPGVYSITLTVTGPTEPVSEKKINLVKVSIPTSVENNKGNVPGKFALFQNYPNPFNPSTSIQYTVGSNQFVQLKVYDVLGNDLVTLVNEEKPAGNYKVEFNAANLPSGIYFYRLKAGAFSEIKKMLLVK
jgi:hypothetical protein